MTLLEKHMLLEIHSLRTCIADQGVTPPMLPVALEKLYYDNYKEPQVLPKLRNPAGER